MVGEGDLEAGLKKPSWVLATRVGNVKALCAGARELKPVTRSQPPGKPPSGRLGLAIAPGGGVGGPGLYPEHVLKSDQGNGQLTAKMTTVVSITSSPLKGFPAESLSTSAPWRWGWGGWGRGPGKPGSRAHHGLPVLLALLVALGVVDGDGQRVCLLLLLPKLQDLQHLSWEVGADMVKTPPPLLPATCPLSHGTPDLQL